MARTSFQAKVTLLSATPTNGDNTEWECQVQFTDNDGAYSGMDIAIGDIIAIDTSVVENGSFTLYTVFGIVTPDYASPTLAIRYDTVINDNAFGSPDLSWVIGQDTAIARPSPKLGLLPVVSRDLQVISDKYTEYVQNYNFVKIVDNLQSGNQTFTKTNGESYPLIKGMAVYITEVDEANCRAAVATAAVSSRVLGLIADAAVAPGAVASISSKGMLEKPTTDWDIITGEVGGLRPSHDYFLRAGYAGGITSVPPTAVNNFVVKIGKAVSPTVLDVNIEQPIEL